MTTAWGINASYEHYWTPAVHESLFGAYYAVSYGNATGGGNAMLCADEGLRGGTSGATAVANAGCNNNWSMFAVGSRLQWDVTKTFYLGVELLYDQMNSATTASSAIVPANIFSGTTGSPASALSRTAHAWVATARVHKDFLP